MGRVAQGMGKSRRKSNLNEIRVEAMR